MNRLEIVAAKINQFSYDYDPYGYEDALWEPNDPLLENGLRQLLDELNYGGEATMEWLRAIAEDDDEYEEHRNKAKELLEELKDVLRHV